MPACRTWLQGAVTHKLMLAPEYMQVGTIMLLVTVTLRVHAHTGGDTGVAGDSHTESMCIGERLLSGEDL